MATRQEDLPHGPRENSFWLKMAKKATEQNEENLLELTETDIIKESKEEPPPLPSSLPKVAQIRADLKKELAEEETKMKIAMARRKVEGTTETPPKTAIIQERPPIDLTEVRKTRKPSMFEKFRSYARAAAIAIGINTIATPLDQEAHSQPSISAESVSQPDQKNLSELEKALGISQTDEQSFKIAAEKPKEEFNYFGITHEYSKEMINDFINTLGELYGLSKEQAINGINMARIRTDKENILHKIVNSPIAAGTEFYNYLTKTIKENQKNTGDSSYWDNFTRLSNQFGVKDPNSKNADSRLATMAARVHHLTATDDKGNEITNFKLRGDSKGPNFLIPPISPDGKGIFTNIQDYDHDRRDLFKKGHRKSVEQKPTIVAETSTVAPATTKTTGHADSEAIGRAEAKKWTAEVRQRVKDAKLKSIKIALEQDRTDLTSLKAELAGVEKDAGRMFDRIQKEFNRYKKEHGLSKTAKWADIDNSAFHALTQGWREATAKVKDLSLKTGNTEALLQIHQQQLVDLEKGGDKNE